jgi:hypothetical protein
MEENRMIEKIAVAFAEWIGRKVTYEFDGDKWYHHGGDCYYETKSLYRDFLNWYNENQIKNRER